MAVWRAWLEKSAGLAMTPSRRLQLAAETSGTIGIAIRRWRRPAEAADFGSRPPARPAGG